MSMTAVKGNNLTKIIRVFAKCSQFREADYADSCQTEG